MTDAELAETADPSIDERSVRLALLRAGYTPLPSIGKQCKMLDWPRVTVNEAFIRHVSRSRIYTGSGVRIDRDLLVLDVDTDIIELADALGDEIARRAPTFIGGGVVRHSGGASFAVFGRWRGAATVKPPGKLGTARFKLDGKGRNHAVELFGPAAKKFVACSGPHTIRDGVVTRAYGYYGKALWEVPYDALPELDDALVLPLLGALQAIIEAWPGMVKTQPERHAGHGFDKVYDLEERQIVRLEDGTQESVRALGQRLVGGGYEKCYANLWDPASTTPDRCRVGVAGKGLYIIDFKLETTHHLVSSKPFEQLQVPSYAERQKIFNQGRKPA